MQPSLPAETNRACRAEQLYVTHCTRDDSVLGQEGFGVRAASSSDPALLQFALQLPAHELPADAAHLGLTPAQMPRRLARIELPDGRVALVYSTYAAHDTRGRDDSYFTHALVYPKLTLIEALRAWAAPQWQSECPPGAPKQLPCFEGVPVGDALNDGVLADFLNATATPAVQRRDWLRLMLAACLRFVLTSASEQKFVYVRAEPEVVALLLYGVARLLPESLLDHLTFSTYERPGQSLREQSHARFLGTWTAGRQPWPDADGLQRRGYLLDLEHDPIESELWKEVSPGIDGLVSLAAARDWGAVAEVHALWQRQSPAACDALTEAVLAQPIVHRLRSSSAALPDVAELAGQRLGRELLIESEATLWPLIWQHCLDDEASRDAFAGLLRRHRAELEERLAASVGASTGPPWSRQWALLRAVLPPEETSASFRRLLQAAAGNTANLPAGLRLELLATWQTLEPHLAFLPPEQAGLLDTATPDELAQLAAADLPERWLGQALQRALAGGRPPAEVSALLTAGPPRLAKGFCAAVAHLDAEQADLRLAPLLPAGSPQAIALFSLLQNAGLSLDPAVLERLLRRMEVISQSWLQYWLQGENLIWLGRALAPQGKLLRQIWTIYVKNVRKKFLLGERAQRVYVERLQAARLELGDRVPPEAAQVLDDWLCLRAQLCDPPEADAKHVAIVAATLRRRQIKSSLALLKRHFAAALAASEPMSEDDQTRLVRSVRGFCGPSVEQAFPVLLDLLADCPAPLRSVYQRFFLSCAAPDQRDDLVQRHSRRLDLADGRIEELLAAGHRRERRRWIGFMVGILLLAGLVGVALGLALR